MSGRAKPTMAWAMSERKARTSTGMFCVSEATNSQLTAVSQLCEEG